MTITDGRTERAPRGPAATVSVIICCYTERRWDDVMAGLRSLRAQSRRPDQVVVVVDHNDELLQRLARTIDPDGRTMVLVANEGAQGLSGARNTGVAAATGDVVAFLDDDAAAGDDRWVAGLLAPYDDPQVWGVGGAAHPDWGGPGEPAWFPSEFGWVVGCTYRGQPERPAPVRNFLGCNMSFRRAAFDEVGGFTEGIGRVGTNPVGCEETEFCIRLRQAHPDATLVYDPAVWVRHHVSEDRTRFRYFRARCLAEGRSKALVAGEVGSDDALSSERAYATRVLPTAVLRGLTGPFRGDWSGPRRAVAVLAGLLLTGTGYLQGRLRARRR
jgi:GT2 family glycosyltransferase